MRSKFVTAALLKSSLAASILTLVSGVSLAQQAVNVSVAPTTYTAPDGSVLPAPQYPPMPVRSTPYGRGNRIPEEP